MSVRCAFNSGIPQQAAGIWGNSIVIDTLDEAYETKFNVKLCGISADCGAGVPPDPDPCPVIPFIQL